MEAKSALTITNFQICCFPSNILGKKSVLHEEMTSLTSNSSDPFLQNLQNLRNHRDTTPTKANSKNKNEEIVLLEKQGRSSQKLRSNLAQISSTIGQNMTDISNIDQSSGSSKVRESVHSIIKVIFLKSFDSFRKLFYHHERIDNLLLHRLHYLGLREL